MRSRIRGSTEELSGGSLFDSELVFDAGRFKSLSLPASFVPQFHSRPILASQFDVSIEIIDLS
jgi:hypothetical protein